MSYLIQQSGQFRDQISSSVLLQFSHSRKDLSKNHQATNSCDCAKNAEAAELQVLCWL